MAASSSSTPLPAPPSELKALAPFLQRANELAKADTVMSYWSLYHAAQLGVAATAKAQDKETRPFLYSLMDRLEEVSDQNVGQEVFKTRLTCSCSFPRLRFTSAAESYAGQQ